VLFKVIAGASSIQTDLKEVCDVFHMSPVERWRKLFRPRSSPT
jgi:ABC-type anion transport system duplicated permease subunit